MKIIDRLRARRGETLTELLCAVLVTAIAMALLTAMITSASRMNRNAELADKKLYQALSEAQSGTSPVTADPNTVDVSVTNGAAQNKVSFQVVFSGDADELLAYAPTEGGGGG